MRSKTIIVKVISLSFTVWKVVQMSRTGLSDELHPSELCFHGQPGAGLMRPTHSEFRFHIPLYFLCSEFALIGSRKGCPFLLQFQGNWFLPASNWRSLRMRNQFIGDPELLTSDCKMMMSLEGFESSNLCLRNCMGPAELFPKPKYSSSNKNQNQITS